ncbi:hypothetical protein MSIBF_A2680025 [groundwater metagenome]|uniref:Uncharacterized protein n=1 Tax=groundwater metagenome TaxID=717931 RepID=A0A098E9R5_9ZZZZ
MVQNNINKENKEDKGGEKKKKRNFFPIIFFAALILLFFGTYLFLHPYVDKPPEISTAENAALQKENAGNIAGAIDEYNNLLNKENNSEKKCIYYTRIAKLYSQLEKEEIAKGYYENAANIAGEKKFSNCMYEAMFWRWYYEKNATCLMKAVDIAENLNGTKKKFYAYSQLANYYLNLQNFTKAKEIYDKAMALSNEGEYKTIGYNYLGIGTLYTEWNMYDIALQNLKLAEDYLKKSDDNKGLMDTYLRIAYVYAKNNDSENAMVYYEKAVKISNIANKSSNAELGIAYMYITLAQKKLENKDYNDAIEHSKIAINLLTEYHGSEEDRANAQNILCYAYFAIEWDVEADQCYGFLKIELLDNDANKFKAYKSMASLNEFFGLAYEGIEITVAEDENGTMKPRNTSCGRILLAVDDYKKAAETGKKINVSDEETKGINAKISELENKAKECNID